MVIEFDGLTDAEIAALAKAGGGPTLPVGEHAVDFCCRVSGLLRQGEPTDYTPTVAIPHKRAMAFLVQFSGLAGEAALSALAMAMRAALESEREPDLAIVEQAEAMVAAAVGSLPRQRRRGRLSVVGDLLIERVPTPRRTRRRDTKPGTPGSGRRRTR